MPAKTRLQALAPIACLPCPHSVRRATAAWSWCACLLAGAMLTLAAPQTQAAPLSACALTPAVVTATVEPVTPQVSREHSIEQLTLEAQFIRPGIADAMLTYQGFDGSVEAQFESDAAGCPVPHLRVSLWAQQPVIHLARELDARGCRYAAALDHEQLHAQAMQQAMADAARRLTERAELALTDKRVRALLLADGQRQAALHEFGLVLAEHALEESRLAYEVSNLSIDGPDEADRLALMCQGDVQP